MRCPGCERIGRSCERSRGAAITTATPVVLRTTSPNVRGTRGSRAGKRRHRGRTSSHRRNETIKHVESIWNAGHGYPAASCSASRSCGCSASSHTIEPGEMRPGTRLSRCSISPRPWAERSCVAPTRRGLGRDPRGGEVALPWWASLTRRSAALDRDRSPIGERGSGAAVDDGPDADPADTHGGGEPLLNTQTGSRSGRLLSRSRTIRCTAHYSEDKGTVTGRLGARYVLRRSCDDDEEEKDPRPRRAIPGGRCPCC